MSDKIQSDYTEVERLGFKINALNALVNTLAFSLTYVNALMSAPELPSETEITTAEHMVRKSLAAFQLANDTGLVTKTTPEFKVATADRLAEMIARIKARDPDTASKIEDILEAATGVRDPRTSPAYKGAFRAATANETKAC